MNRPVLLTLIILHTLPAEVRSFGALAQAFTYQGALHDGAVLAVDGFYDLRFRLYEHEINNVPSSPGESSHLRIPVTNGLFTVKLAFPSAVFDGREYWVQIEARTNDNTRPYVSLAPRQQITPTPYALYAASAASISGTLPSAQLPPNVAFLDRSQTFTANQTFNGVINLAGSANFSAPAIGSDASHIYYGPTGDWYIRSASRNGKVVLQDAGGNVGIGTMTPQSKVHVATASSLFGGLSLDDNAGGFIRNLQDLESSYFIRARQKWEAINGGQFYSSLFVLRGDGKVGIGTDTPSRNLEVAGVGDVEIGLNSLRLWTVQSSGNAAGNAGKFQIIDRTASASRLTIAPDGNIGIGTTSPGAKLHIQKNGLHAAVFAGHRSPAFDAAAFESNLNAGGLHALFAEDDREVFMVNSGGGGYFAGNVAIGTAMGIANSRLHAVAVGGNGVQGNSSDPIASGVYGENNGHGFGVAGRTTGAGSAIFGDNMDPSGWAGYFNGKVSTCSLTIRGGCDLAEPFQMSQTHIPTGAVVVIDENNPGHLKMSDLALDTRVAGIISGANGVNTGLLLQQDGLIEGGQNVALSGRVYALADASHGPIQPGDLLTTSNTAGHAMKVTDHARAQGAIIGKAMTALKEGRGMVLVLVSLQ